MTQLLCRCRVEDFEKWKAVFDSHAELHREAGLTLTNMWRSISEPDDVFFVFKVKDLELAKAFMNSPDSVEAGEVSGVLDGEYYFADSTPIYQTNRFVRNPG